MLTARANRAILRRVLLIGGVVLAVTLALWQRCPLYRLEVVDFAKRQQQEPGWTGRRQESLDRYIAGRTEGRLLRKTDRAWLNLYEDVAAAGQYRFFLPDSPPLQELAGAFDDRFTYVALERDSQPRYLGVTVWRPGDFAAPPADVRYPLRWLALWGLVAGVLGYALIPWPKRDPNVVAYGRFVSSLLPDFGVGLLLLAVFYTMPWFIVPGQAQTSHPLVIDGGWIVLTAVMWGMSLFGLAIHITAAWYEALCIRVADDHLLIESLRGAERVPFADIERLTWGMREPPRTLIKAGLLISLLNWRAAGPTLLAASRDDPVLCLVMRNGRQRKFGLTAIHHLERLTGALRQAGIAVDPEPTP